VIGWAVGIIVDIIGKKVSQIRDESKGEFIIFPCTIFPDLSRAFLYEGCDSGMDFLFVEITCTESERWSLGPWASSWIS